MRLACLCLLSLLAASARAEDKLLACTEDADYPPFTYVDRSSGQRQIRGTTADLLDRLGRQIGMPIEIVMTSLKRCLLGVQRGIYDIGLDFYKDAERARKFDYSPPYMALQPYYYFDKSRYPEGLDVRRKADLHNYRGCGIIGYSYAHFGLAEGPKFDISAQSHLTVGRMLFAGRCDYFPAAREIVEGYRAMGETEIVDNPKLGFAPVPDAPAQNIHLIYSRESARLKSLRPAIDAFLVAQKPTTRAPR
mgnify:FL=1|jgi:polar amino acid transport system substrate-binding protein